MTEPRITLTVETPEERERSYQGIRKALGMPPAPAEKLTAIDPAELEADIAELLAADGSPRLKALLADFARITNQALQERDASRAETEAVRRERDALELRVVAAKARVRELLAGRPADMWWSDHGEECIYDPADYADQIGGPGPFVYSLQQAARLDDAWFVAIHDEDRGWTVTTHATEAEAEAHAQGIGGKKEKAGGFYLQDSRSYVGNCVLWWRDGGGYTTRLHEAQVFTPEEAASLHANRATDVPWPVGTIRSIQHNAVDAQRLPKKDATNA